MKRFFREELALIALMGAAMVQTGLAFEAMNGMVRSTHTVMSETAPQAAMVRPLVLTDQDALALAHAGDSRQRHHPALQD